MKTNEKNLQELIEQALTEKIVEQWNYQINYTAEKINRTINEMRETAGGLVGYEKSTALFDKIRERLPDMLMEYLVDSEHDTVFSGKLILSLRYAELLGGDTIKKLLTKLIEVPSTSSF